MYSEKKSECLVFKIRDLIEASGIIRVAKVMSNICLLLVDIALLYLSGFKRRAILKSRVVCSFRYYGTSLTFP